MPETAAQVRVQTQTTTMQNFNNVKAPEYLSVYANNTAFQMNAFDIGVIFGEIVAVDEAAGIATVEQKVRVVMSPLHAKILAFVMLQNIQQYEERFGEIKVAGAMLRTAAGDEPAPSAPPVPTPTTPEGTAAR